MIAKRNNSKKYIIGLLITWLLGCIFQYLLCCKEDVEKVTVSATPVAKGSDTGNVAETQPEPAPEATVNAFKVSGNDIDIEFGSEENFNFLANQETPIQPASEGLQSNSKQLANYLTSNTDSRLTVTGLYHSDEKNTSTFDNLGLARANQIKEYLVSQGANAEQIDTDSQVDDQTIADTGGKYLGRADFTLIEVDASDRVTPQQYHQSHMYDRLNLNVFKVSGDDVSIELDSEDNFDFLANQEMPVTPMSEGLQNNSKQLVDYLANNADARLTVTGLYRSDEENTSIFPNLGLARANQIKEYLVSQGANAQQIDIAGLPDGNAVAGKDGKYLGRANFNVVKTDGILQQQYADEMKQLLANIQVNPVTVYFATGDSNIKLTAEQRSTIFDMIRYLDFDGTAKVSVTGHTDSVGNTEANTKLGKKRAIVFADYLASKGLKKERINITSEGPNQPIADNATEEGRAKNRRVTVSMANEKVN